MIPSLVVDGLAGGFLVLVVAEHDIGAAGENLAWHVGWVGTVDLHLHVDDGTTA